jgi:hypothetical protein
MLNMAAEIGNKYAVGRSGHKWHDAIRKALANDKQALERVAVALIASAEAGDMAAIKELGDRLDGKAVATVQADVTQHESVVRLPVVAASTEGWQKRYPAIQ